jgi:deazaflavin-dependent oxidoreductase (nitroreductase family)
MFGSLLPVLAGATIVAVVLAATFVTGMRTKSPLVLRPIVWMSRRFMNPRQLAVAGAPGAYAGIVRHRGRRTGQPYETPVGIVADGDMFLIALPYGPGTQWLRNVRAAGEAVLVTEGRTVRVDRPEVIATRDVVDRFSSNDQRLFRLFGTRDCLRLHRAVVAETTDAAAQPQAA